MSTFAKKRHTNHGMRKVCACPRRRWLKCSHPWHVNFKLKGGELLSLQWWPVKDLDGARPYLYPPQPGVWSPA